MEEEPDIPFDEFDSGIEESGTPEAVVAPCPDCGTDTTHAVLHGTLGSKAGFTLDATVQCEECDRVHHVLLKEPAPIEVPVIVSAGPQSVKTRALFIPTDRVAIGDEFPLNERRVQVTGVELPSGKRVNEADVASVRTIWVRDFESVALLFAINMKRKTIAKALAVDPEEEYTVGSEVLFGRLRVTIHAIKTHDTLLRRGPAIARDIVRVFARPTRLGRSYRPPPEERARQRRERAGFE